MHGINLGDCVASIDPYISQGLHPPRGPVRRNQPPRFGSLLPLPPVAHAAPEEGAGVQSGHRRPRPRRQGIRHVEGEAHDRAEQGQGDHGKEAVHGQEDRQGGISEGPTGERNNIPAG